MPSSSTELPEDRVVAFIDILGFKDLVSRLFSPEGGSSLHEILGNLQHVAEQQKWAHATNQSRQWMREVLPSIRASDPEPDLQVTAFSDSIVFSDRLCESGAREVIIAAQRLAVSLLERGILCRGGISLGPTYHKDGILFGLGMNRAYQLESEVARYPRIVLADQVPIHGLTLLFGLTVEADFDGCRIIDLFSSIRVPKPNPFDLTDLTPGPPDVARLTQIRTVIQREILRHTSADSPTGVLVKFRWLGHKFNAAIQSLGLTAVPPVAL